MLMSYRCRFQATRQLPTISLCNAKNQCTPENVILLAVELLFALAVERGGKPGQGAKMP
jgi:hypothetical protein